LGKHFRLVLLVKAALLAAIFAGAVPAQDLSPRAYLITPSGANAVTVSWSFNDGSVLLDPSIPVDNLSFRFQTAAVTYYHAWSFFGRSSNIAVVLPYAVANGEGTVLGTPTKAYRSGLADSRIRFSVNLKGGPAMSLREFASWREKSLIGVSFTAVVPTGQYDPARVVNNGTNRWAFKPEIGLSRRWRNWALEGYVGVWLYTPNHSYFPGSRSRTLQPVGAGEVHLTRYFKPRLWFSVDGNYWNGGRSSINGIQNDDEQRNSRAGLTAAIPIDGHQSVKFSYARGAYVQIGGNYRTLSFAWQYSWVGPKR
jgi:hypothetical protein